MIQRLLTVLAVVALAFLSTPQSSFAESLDDGAQKAILVTGASSGIGLNIAKTLAAEGYFVYAGARKQADLDALNKIPNIQSVRLDVTKQAEIDAAVKTVRAGGKGLYGLVNNAGIVVSGPLTEIEEDELNWIFNVNVIGVFRVTKAFAPLIIESKGRISNISSISGVLSGMLWGPYGMSKHALEAYTDALEEEMALFDVKVSAINPGNYRSRIGTKESSVLAKKPYAQPGSPYAEAMAGHIEYLSDRSMYKEPDEVTAAVVHALFADAPKPNYLVVPNEREAGWTIGRMIEETAELNADQPYSYSDEELIEMLKAATAVQRARGQ
ncbi:MAG: SDR family oxidoreductase [Gammaproteobacteria bacterium]|mgnify:FL=1|nr:SDR family oxidoreductase [Gammaproteobacteria bacterium]